MLCTFRPFQPKDEAKLQAMVKQFYEEEAAEGPMDREKVKLTIKTLGEQPSAGAILIAEGEVGILGYAIVIHYWSNEYGGWLAFLDELFITPPFRGLGLGTKFVQYITLEYGEKIIGTGLEVMPNNTRALQLYQRLGFKLDGLQHLLHLKGE
ncbi:MAG: GNAT family N-acetyltransferase [Cyanothece sp. SIO1E1]|nr:GNAT family N-acetyltransferase [Cyanothece sp. SIO1E1]